jgi:hypothetical protein
MSDWKMTMEQNDALIAEVQTLCITQTVNSHHIVEAAVRLGFVAPVILIEPLAPDPDMDYAKAHDFCYMCWRYGKHRVSALPRISPDFEPTCGGDHK